MEIHLNHDEQEVRNIYKDLLNAWNNNSASSFAKLFASDGNTIGFDGSQMNGQKQIEEELSKIFANHKVSTYVSIVKEVRRLSSSVYLLRAVAGMIPPEKSEINPKVNAIQTLIAEKLSDHFQIALFQNTPAAFHERPDLAKQLTDELQEVFDEQN
ncbi:MAG: SgcJ/EcaC family oxidoreductase [Chitinophagaceae bacterium]|nr:SgcJ/EcaC family oxidoreductase [Chitinophagaceae bacterium]